MGLIFWRKGKNAVSQEAQPSDKATAVSILQSVEAALQYEIGLIHCTTIYDRLFALRIATANGCIKVLSMLLDRSVQPDMVNRHKQYSSCGNLKERNDRETIWSIDLLILQYSSCENLEERDDRKVIWSIDLVIL